MGREDPQRQADGTIPWPVKLGYAGMTAVIVPIYLRYYGWRNFLWLSDLALFALTLGLWRERRGPISTAAVGTLAYELAWTADFTAVATTGRSPLRIAGYMRDRSKPLFLRSLSLFHLALPTGMLWALSRLGYDRRAWRRMTLLSWLLLPLTRLLTGPERNINWVHGPGRPQTTLPAPLWVALQMALMPPLVFAPTHWLLLRRFGDRSTLGAHRRRRHHQ